MNATESTPDAALDPDGGHARESPASPVSSYSEWEPLEEVLVGSLDGAACVPWEAGVHAVTPRESLDLTRSYHLAQGGTPVPDALLRAATRELEEFVALLEDNDVKVRRPCHVDHARPIVTPLWSSPGGNSHANPRDLLIVLGDEILEAPMSWRSRYFEYIAYRPLLREYFLAGAKWSAAPKPTMDNTAYDWQFADGTGYVTTNHEIMFDAADMVRCGQDVFVQRSHVTNDLAIEWLRRQYGDRFNFHRVEFHDYRAIHIDATFVPLRPGVIMVNPERPLTTVPPILANSTWRMIEPPLSVHSRGATLDPATRWLHLNVLSLDERRIIVEASERPMQQFLTSEGFEVLPCPFRNNYAFGGSFHCATVDIRRRGGLQSYFSQ